MVNEKQDSFNGQLAKWITPILLTIIGFSMREYYISINNSLDEMKAFMNAHKIEIVNIQNKIDHLEKSDESQNIILRRIDDFFLVPEKNELKRKK